MTTNGLNIPDGKKVILFDGICNLCNSSVIKVIKHDKNGLLVQPGNKEQLYQSLKAVVTDTQLQQRLAHHTEKLNAFNDVVMASKHVKMYRNITGL